MHDPFSENYFAKNERLLNKALLIFMNKHHPTKALGQHFLHDVAIVRRIVKSAKFNPGERVLEIGPGKGHLTQGLLDSGAIVKAVEIDKRLVDGPLKKFMEVPDVTVIHEDASKRCGFDFYREDENYGLIANLPYNVGTKILRNFLSGPNPPVYSVVMLQREVARNIVPLEGKATILSSFLGAFVSGKFLFTVKPHSFRPKPKVTSAVIRLNKLEEPFVLFEESEFYFQFVAAVFRSPRKQIHNSLSMGLEIDSTATRELLDKNGIEPMRRPGTLSLLEFQSLFEGAKLLNLIPMSRKAS